MAVFGPNKRRKIPVPKRHGIRDPLKKLAEREAAIKDQVNNPPKERDVQEVSNRFKRFIQLKEQAQNGPRAPNSRRQKRQQERSNLRVGSSIVQQLPKESEEAFLKRASKVQEDRVLEASFSSKFNVEVERNEQTGAVRLKKKKSYEIDELLKRKAKEESIGVKRTKQMEARDEERKKQKLSLSEKRALKKQKGDEKRRKEEDKLLEEYQQDTFKFGEVVHGPPTLNTKPRHAEKLAGAPRPGVKGLLLHSLLNSNNDQEEPEESRPKKEKSKKKKQDQKVDLKGKRKKLPIATRLKLEHEQQNVVEMYRQLKKIKKG
ncbi:GRB10-interacting GYF protein 2 [Wyeomyia smithii]|uniref:GRB10-interacting GYF protein 2 n=1 Tax=Wyeomyia smithii TaxID=174621 RepID=UPI002467B65D|nr:GRB10-interacting GYF protein 2 [Wyeomyia smithii]